MDSYGGCLEVGELLGVTPARVRKLCQQGRVVGAQQAAMGWVIPLPPQILPAAKRFRRDGVIAFEGRLPAFLESRVPKPGPSRFADPAQQLERDATRLAAHLWALALREGDAKSRLGRLLRVAGRADKRAVRRFQASEQPPTAR